MLAYISVIRTCSIEYGLNCFWQALGVSVDGNMSITVLGKSTQVVNLTGFSTR